MSNLGLPLLLNLTLQCIKQTKGLFTWREENSSKKKILDWRNNFSLSLNVEISVRVVNREKELKIKDNPLNYPPLFLSGGLFLVLGSSYLSARKY